MGKSIDSATTRDNQPILAPAPTSGLNINGQRARANFVSIDGVDATDASVNGVRATLSQEAVQEFQILKSPLGQHLDSQADQAEGNG